MRHVPYGLRAAARPKPALYGWKTTVIAPLVPSGSQTNAFIAHPQGRR